MKTQIINIHSSKSECFFIKDGVLVINLNMLIKRYNMDKNYINNELKSRLVVTDKVNFTNLASLCYKLGISYVSDECLKLIQRLVNDFRNINPNIIFTQNGIHNQGEVDMLPFDSLFYIDQDTDTIYVNKILRDKLRLLGYADSQFSNILINFNKIEKILPPDLLKDVAIANNATINSYNKMKELLY